jgi:hypothetical protein
MHRITNITITPEILKLIAEIDEFKGRWTVIKTLAPEKLTTLRRIATIESVGSSTRIEGSKLNDAEVEKLLSGLHTKSFASRDEEEVAGYADAMDMIFAGYDAIASTENHIKQLHGVLLKYSSKDQDHSGQYKTVTNHVEASPCPFIAHFLGSASHSDISLLKLACFIGSQPGRRKLGDSTVRSTSVSAWCCGALHRAFQHIPYARNRMRMATKLTQGTSTLPEILSMVWLSLYFDNSWNKAGSSCSKPVMPCR